MKPFLNLRISAALAVLLSCLMPLAADPPKPAKPETKPNRTTDGDPEPWRRRLTEFQADGLPLSEVANALSEKFPEVNFVLDPMVKETMVALKLRSVTLEDIFTAIGITTQTGGVDPATGFPSQGAVQANKVSDRMVSFTLRQTPAPETTKPICRAFSLARYLAGKSAEEAGKALGDVEQVLETCWMLLGQADPASTKSRKPQLSLHRATKLLVVVGQPDHIEVVEQVISQLEGGGGGGGVAGDGAGGPGGMSFGPAGGSPDTMSAFAARYGLGIRPGVTPSPSSASTNRPAETK